MESPEEKIAKALDGLRDAKASPGLETRVLRAVRDHAPQPVSSMSRWGALVSTWNAGHSPVVPTILLICAFSLAGLLTYSFTPHTPKPLRAQQQPTTPVAKFQPSPAPETIAGIYAPQSGPHAQDMKPAALRKTRHLHATLKPAWQAASFPAPPLPLSEQEKLLLQIARSRKPAQLAPLQHDTQIAQAERDKLEFNKFFKQDEGAAHATN